MTKETGLEIINATPNDLVVPNDVSTGLETIGVEDLIIPRITINNKKHPGVIYCDATGDEWSEGTFSLIKVLKQRVMWPEKFSKDNEPLCKSNNGIMPADDIDSPFAHKCSECPEQSWGADGEPPACKKVYQMLLVNLDEMMPCWFAAASKAYAPTRRLLTALVLKTKKYGNCPAFFLQFNLYPEFVEGDSGDYYVPVYKNVKLIEDPAMRDVMVEIARDLAKERDADVGDRVEGEVPF